MKLFILKYVTNNSNCKSICDFSINLRCAWRQLAKSTRCRHCRHCRRRNSTKRFRSHNLSDLRIVFELIRMVKINIWLVYELTANIYELSSSNISHVNSSKSHPNFHNIWFMSPQNVDLFSEFNLEKVHKPS